tara:strand:- start:68 stop:340 length:273 start_codon:yes stop_codon:yes gene_type:complete
MKCGLFTNNSGQVLLVHRSPFELPVIWIEYDESLGTLTLIHRGGKVQDIGLKIDKTMKKNLSHGTQVTIALMPEQQIESTEKTVLIVKNY